MSLCINEMPPGDRGLKEFVKLPWLLYRGDSFWTPPLNAELLGNRFLGITGLLTPRHIYHRHAETTHFLARRGGEPVGRISAAINHRFNEYYKVKAGFFGFFEVINDYAVADALLDRASNWAGSRGMQLLRGPGEYSNATHERQGILVEGFQFPPTFDCTHNPPYYGLFLEKYGFRKAKDYHAYIMDINREFLPRLISVAEAAKRRHRFEMRPIDFGRFKDEVRLMVSIYNDAWKENWGFLPILDEEADALADMLKPVMDPQGMRFAFVNDEPAAVMAIIPDINDCFRPRRKWYGDSDPIRLMRLLFGRKRISRVRWFFYGTRQQFRNWGIEAALGASALAYGSTRQYTSCEASLILEDNIGAFGPLLKFMNAHRYKTWRIYDLQLGAADHPRFNTVADI